MEMIRNANNLLQVISNTNDYLLNSFELVTGEEVKDNLHRIKIHVDPATELLKSIDFN
jgi:hypothetical protein